MPQTIYYLPGRGGQLLTGLGQVLISRGLQVIGRETLGQFRDLSFAEQVQVISDDLHARFWDEDSLVIANSFGAYLFLHAQTQMPPYPGRVLILSPIVGEFESHESGTVYSPPYPKRLSELASQKAFPTPRNARVHVGELDWQSVPANVIEFGALTGIPVTVVPGAGHMLPKDYVGELLDTWLRQGLA
jgi:hypothetical protein